MALVEVSVVEQRYRAVLEVKAGVPVTEVAARAGVSRQSVHAWVRRYEQGGLGALADRPKRPDTCPHQTSAQVEAAVCEMRREHPKWGPLRLAHELGKAGVVPAPSRMSVYRVLVRHGLIEPGPRKRPKDSYLRWERDEPMALWQLDIVGGAFLADGTEAKVVTGVDDHSRYCVIASVVARATGRAVCLAFAAALRAFGVPGEVLTDNGKQFTDRFGKGGEVLFDRICRDNGIVHRLTQPRSPTTTGKIERFHGSCAGSCSMTRSRSRTWPRRRPQSTPGCGSTTRPGRIRRSGWPSRRTGSAPPAPRLSGSCCRCGCPPSWPWPRLAPADPPQAEPQTAGTAVPDSPPGPYHGGPVEFARPVPPSGNMEVLGKQFWLGTGRAGVMVTVLGQHRGDPPDYRRSPRQVGPLAPVRRGPGPPGRWRRTARGTTAHPRRRTRRSHRGRPGGQSKDGHVSLGGRYYIAAEILGGMLVSIRIEQNTLMFFDPATRVLLRTRPSPLTWDQARLLRGARPAGPPPRPSAEPVTAQRVASNTGVIMVAGQKIALGPHPRPPYRHRPRRRRHDHHRPGQRRHPHRPADHRPAGPQHQSPAAPQGRPCFLGNLESMSWD